jgi:hypothetical protein
LPQIVFAADTTIVDLISAASSIITSTLIPLAFALCLLYFFWGVTKYIKEGASSDKAAEEGRRIMTWGVVGLFVAFSIWGIIKFIQGEFQINPIEKATIQK